MKTILVVFLSFIMMFLGCGKDEPVNPDPPVPNPEYIIITVRAVDSQLFDSKIAVPALNMENNSMSRVNDDDPTREKKVVFSYDDFHNTSQLVKVMLILDPNGDGKSPWEIVELEQNILIDEDKVIVFSQ
ncbi:MAG: hypothetical protein K9M44_01210 [Candidatus Pacebacteria bacterium]|nr:hypothetical protein [Candidatus Paceibacterota bacterium]